MENSIWLNPVMNEVVFDGRNKNYGAFALRNSYDRNMSKGMVIGILFFIACISSPVLLKYLGGDVPMDKEVFIFSPDINLENFKREIPVKQPVTPPHKTPPPVKSLIKYLIPTVVDDTINIVEEIPIENDSLVGKIVGNHDQGPGKDSTDIGIIDDPLVSPYIPDLKPEPTVYNSYAVQQQPEFPDGSAAMYKFLTKNLKFPELAKEIGLSGTVYIQFIVSKEGTIEDAKVIRGVGGGLDQETLRVINLMPKWKPGKHNGRPVAVHMTLPVKFQLLN